MSKRDEWGRAMVLMCIAGYFQATVVTGFGYWRDGQVMEGLAGIVFVLPAIIGYVWILSACRRLDADGISKENGPGGCRTRGR